MCLEVSEIVGVPPQKTQFPKTVPKIYIELSLTCSDFPTPSNKDFSTNLKSRNPNKNQENIPFWWMAFICLITFGECREINWPSAKFFLLKKVFWTCEGRDSALTGVIKQTYTINLYFLSNFLNMLASLGRCIPQTFIQDFRMYEHFPTKEKLSPKRKIPNKSPQIQDNAPFSWYNLFDSILRVQGDDFTQCQLVARAFNARVRSRIYNMLEGVVRGAEDPRLKHKTPELKTTNLNARSIPSLTRDG